MANTTNPPAIQDLEQARDAASSLVSNLRRAYEEAGTEGGELLQLVIMQHLTAAAETERQLALLLSAARMYWPKLTPNN